MVSTWKKKKGKIWKFVDARVTAELREKGIDNMEWIDTEEWRR